MIYFVAANDLGRVKIGFASEPWKRFSKMQSDSPCVLTMLAFCEGKVRDERALHRRFDADRLHGEWFTLSAAIQAHINTLPPAVKPKRSRYVTDLAEKAGLSKSHVSQILSGKWGCSPRAALAIERASNKEISASDLSPVIALARQARAA